MSCYKTNIEKESTLEMGKTLKQSFSSNKGTSKTCNRSRTLQTELLKKTVCDTCESGLSAVLQQNIKKGWRPIHFASRFLIPLENIDSKNKSELLAVVWAVKDLKNTYWELNSRSNLMIKH